MRGTGPQGEPGRKGNRNVRDRPSRRCPPRAPATGVPRTAVATVCLSGTLEDKLAAAAAAGLRRRRDLRARLGRVAVVRRGDPAPVRRPRPVDRPLPAVPRLRRRPTPSVLAANLRRAERKFDVMEQLGTDLILVCSSVSPDAVDDDDRIAEQLHAARRRGPPSAGCASPTRRWPGAATSTPTSGRGRSCAAPTTRRSGLCVDSFHILSRGSDPAGHPRTSRARSCSSCSWPTRRTWTWTCCSGAATTGCSPARAPSTCRRSSATCSTAGYTGPLSLEVFNDVFRQSDPRAPPSTRCARCWRCRRRTPTG